MAKYEVTVNGQVWQCDTLDEARALEGKEKRKAVGKVKNGTQEQVYLTLDSAFAAHALFRGITVAALHKQIREAATHQTIQQSKEGNFTREDIESLRGAAQIASEEAIKRPTPRNAVLAVRRAAALAAAHEQVNRNRLTDSTDTPIAPAAHPPLSRELKEMFGIAGPAPHVTGSLAEVILPHHKPNFARGQADAVKEFKRGTRYHDLSSFKLNLGQEKISYLGSPSSYSAGLLGFYSKIIALNKVQTTAAPAAPTVATVNQIGYALLSIRLADKLTELNNFMGVPRSAAARVRDFPVLLDEIDNLILDLDSAGLRQTVEWSVARKRLVGQLESAVKQVKQARASGVAGGLLTAEGAARGTQPRLTRREGVPTPAPATPARPAIFFAPQTPEEKAARRAFREMQREVNTQDYPPTETDLIEAIAETEREQHQQGRQYSLRDVAEITKLLSRAIAQNDVGYNQPLLRKAVALQITRLDFATGPRRLANDTPAAPAAPKHAKRLIQAREAAREAMRVANAAYVANQNSRTAQNQRLSDQAGAREEVVFEKFRVVRAEFEQVLGDAPDYTLPAAEYAAAVLQIAASAAPPPDATQAWMRSVGFTPAAPAPAAKSGRKPSPLKVTRPKGYEGQSGRDMRNSYTKYLFTLIAPKCNVPIEFFAGTEYGIEHKFCGFSPEGTWYGQGYFGSDYERKEIGGQTCQRQHMLAGLANMDHDQGTGVGPSLYMAGPIAAFAKYGTLCTFSPEGGRTHDANAAWHRAVTHGTAEDIYPEQSTSKQVEVKDYLPDDPSDFDSDWTSITGTDPTEVMVHGTQKGTRLYQWMRLPHILSQAKLLHCEPALWAKIRRTLTGQLYSKTVPPAGGWAKMDLAFTPADKVNEYAIFCAEQQLGRDQQAYMNDVQAALAANPSTPQEILDATQKVKGKAQNPRRNPAKADKQAAAWIKEMSDPKWDA